MSAAYSTGSSLLLSPRTEPPPSDRGDRGDARHGCLYGDSTPFPHEGNFIETIRHAIECGVTLMGAQHIIMRSGARANEVERARQSERAKLESMAVTVRKTVTADVMGGASRLVRTGARILDATRIAVDSELAQLETTAAEELTKARLAKDEARTKALRAVESFLLHHDLPGTQVGLRMIAEESVYASHALVATPFGVEAIFELLVPMAHEWGKVRRVSDVASGVEVHVPLESGLFWKRVEVQAVKLDKLYLSSLHLSQNRSVIALRKQPRSGAGYKLQFDGTQNPTRIVLTKLLEEGTESPEPPIDLNGRDAMHALRLLQRVQDSTSDLAMRRTVATSALIDGRAIQELDEPRLVCERLVRVLAPTVREIAKRAGAPGELVLRRDIRAGRRDEIYITKAELHDKVVTLPPALRTVFEPFELDSPRSPRAPEPSVPAYVEVADEDVEDVTARRTPPQLPPARLSTRPPPPPSQRPS